MFRRPGASLQTGTPQQRYLKRAAAFGGALLLLWLALQLMPSSPPPPHPVSDGAGTVVSNTARPEFKRSSGGVFSFGYVVVLLLLGGGVAFAYRLHKNGTPGPFVATPLKSAGQLYLAPNQQLRLVTIGDDVLLLGVTSGQITLLKTYPRSVLGTSEREPETTIAPKAPDFSAILRQYGIRTPEARG